MITLAILLALCDAPSTDAAAQAIAAMNVERVKCGAPPFVFDARLQKVAAERLTQTYENWSHMDRQGRDPRPALLKKYGFPVGPVVRYQGSWQGSCSEGLGMGSFQPAGLMIPREQYPHEKTWSPRVITHHMDMICPRWNKVGHASGKSPRGISYSVTIFGYDP